MKCKNIECEKETNGKNVYCSLSCRSYYVNTYHRKYDKLHETIKKKKEDDIKLYNLNPKICSCGNNIQYENRFNKFCGKDCVKNNLSINNGIYNISMEDKVIMYKKVSKSLIDYNKSIGNKSRTDIKYCKRCNNIHTNLYKQYCSDNCRKLNLYKNKTEFNIYKRLTIFKFALNKYPNEFDFNLIKEYGWYSPVNKRNNLKGISRDHIISVKYAYENKINPLLIAHPANCQLLQQCKNSVKHSKCDIKIDELLERIEKWDNLYGNYYNEKLETYIDYTTLNNLIK